MYESFYGLKTKPFELHPDPAFFYLSQGHDDAYTHLRYAVEEGKGFVVITGEIGSGKTTLLNVLFRRVPISVVVGLVNNPSFSPVQFLRKVCQEFELEVGRKNKLEILEAFNAFLLERYAAGERVILIVDEAQNLSLRALEELRMLSNLEAERHHLLQIILVGQPELRAQLRRPALTQLLQRVTVHYHLAGLADADVQQYIGHRMRVAGGGEEGIFSPEAIAAICRYSGGVPRLVNMICDLALVYGFAEERRVIDPGIVDEVVQVRRASGLFPEALEQECSEPPPSRAVPTASMDAAESGAGIASLKCSVERLEQAVEELANKFEAAQAKLICRDQRPQLVGHGEGGFPPRSLSSGTAY